MEENTIKNNSTPVMKQYWEAKSKYPGVIMLFRMGDFYETFDDDAKITSKILNIALTKRSNGAASTVPLAGFPYHSLEQHLYKLLNSGHKVALCEQVEDPKLSKGIVKREVVEVLSPGTAITSRYLIDNENNFLASMYFDVDIVGYSIIDNSTGEFFCGEVSLNNIIGIINKYQIKEVIVPDFQRELCNKILNNRIMITAYDDWKADEDNCYEILLNKFKTNSLKGYGIDGNSLIIKSAGACIYYLEKNYFGKTAHITSITKNTKEGYMSFDDFTIRNLEVFTSLNNQGTHGTLINTIDSTITPMGSRLLKKHLREPLANKKRINGRLNLVEELVSTPIIIESISEYLKQVSDIERIIGKISNNKANPQDLSNLANSILILDSINSILSSKNKYTLKLLKNRKNLSKLTNLINKTIIDNPPINIKNNFFIRIGVNQELDEYKNISNDANKWLLDYQNQQRELTSISSLKINFNKIFGYYIDITKTHLDKIPNNYIRKQTLVNSERYFTIELKDYEEKILSSNDKCQEIESRIFESLINKIISQFDKIQNSAKVLSSLDVMVSHASNALNFNYCKPLFNNKNSYKLKKSRHPVVERLLPINEEFISNDLLLIEQKRHLGIITGPNMSGKSTYLRQIGLIALMAQIGSYVPADECELGIVDQLFTRVGASDNLAGGESTFLVEMNEAANILNNATNKSLIILDEVGRGTSTFDGLSIAWAITEYLHNNKLIKSRTLFATHYHELIFLANKLKGTFNLSIDVKEYNDEIIFLRKIKEGGTSKSYGIQVAEMAGLPSEVIIRSKILLSDFMSKKNDVYKNDNKNDDQLVLFDKESKLISKIKSIDTDKISPIEALNILDDLKRKI